MSFLLKLSGVTLLILLLFGFLLLFPFVRVDGWLFKDKTENDDCVRPRESKTCPNLKGDKGERGPPGLTVRGPMGPAGPPGVPREDVSAFLKNEGICACENPLSFPKDQKYERRITTYGTFSEFLHEESNIRDGCLAVVESSVFIKLNRKWFPFALGEPLKFHRKTTKRPSSTTPSIPVSDRPRIERKGLRLIALNSPMTGLLRGVKGVNYHCFRQAKRSNVTGSFKAFLAPQSKFNGRKQRLEYLLRPERRHSAILNLYGERISSSWANLFQDTKGFSNDTGIFTFNGRNVLTEAAWNKKAYWHGNGGWGNTVNDCDGWMDESPMKVGYASEIESGSLSTTVIVPCNERLIVFCIETR